MANASYTLGTLKTEMGEDLQDPTFIHFTETIITKRINNRIADFLERTRLRRYSWSVDLVSDQAEYDLSSLSPRCIEPISVACTLSSGDTNQYELERKEIAEFQQRYPGWRTDPSNWPEVFNRGVAGPHKLILHPRPSSSQSATVRTGTNLTSSLYGGIVSVSGLTTAQATSLYGLTVGVQFLCGAMRIDGIAAGSDLSDDSDDLETDGGVPVQWQKAIKVGALADLCGDVDVPIAQPSKAAQYEAEYEAFVQQALLSSQRAFQGRPAQAGKAKYL